VASLASTSPRRHRSGVVDGPRISRLLKMMERTWGAPWPRERPVPVRPAEGTAFPAQAGRKRSFDRCGGVAPSQGRCARVAVEPDRAAVPNQKRKNSAHVRDRPAPANLNRKDVNEHPPTGVRHLAWAVACNRPHPMPPPSVVTITTTEYAFGCRTRFPRGSRPSACESGKELHHASLVRLRDGKTVADFQRDRGGDEEPHASAAWMGFAGGPMP